VDPYATQDHTLELRRISWKHEDIGTLMAFLVGYKLRVLYLDGMEVGARSPSAKTSHDVECTALRVGRVYACQLPNTRTTAGDPYMRPCGTKQGQDFNFAAALLPCDHAQLRLRGAHCQGSDVMTKEG
jgi:hypothetical protein